MIEIKGCWNPTIIKAGGAIYAVSGSTWLRVPESTTKKDLKWDYVDNPCSARHLIKMKVIRLCRDDKR